MAKHKKEPKTYSVALAGNPNVGKSTVFNCLTGMRQHTGNWAGKTVENAKGRYRFENAEYTLIDLPGTYSLFSRSFEEQCAEEQLSFKGCDAAVVVADGNCLERNLNLVFQIRGIIPNTVLAVNLMDEAKKNGIKIDFSALSEELGIPVVPMSAGRNKGLSELKRTVAAVCENPKTDMGELFLPANAEQPVKTLAKALDGLAVKTEKLSHEGTFGVGYGVCIYEVSGRDANRYFLEEYRQREEEKARKRKNAEDPFVRLARKTIETYVRTGEKISVPERLPEEMYSRRAGVFVSLKEDGRLRGCIGTIAPVRGSIAEEIIENAISAAAKDPRFHAVEPEELERLVYSVDVLGDAEKISSPEELDVKRYGVIVSRGYRRGLLLPDLEGVDTAEDQIEIARQKAGIPEDAEDITLERFEVVRHY